jgi:hypothetical protein
MEKTQIADLKYSLLTTSEHPRLALRIEKIWRRIELIDASFPSQSQIYVSIFISS